MDEKIKKKIEEMINSNEVFLFMKGDPQEPRCGFSARVVYILNKNKIKFDSFDVLEDMEIREGIKIFSEWPTIPQIYVKGNFVGGCDILMELDQQGNLKEELGI